VLHSTGREGALHASPQRCFAAKHYNLISGRKSHHGLGMASGALGQARGAPALRDLEESERALPRAGVGCAQSQGAEILRGLTPMRMLNT
jgi:hypothetical protein